MLKRLLVLLVLLPLLTGCAHAEYDAPLVLTALNVGKADCLLLESGSSLYMIDTGANESWGAVSAFLAEHGIDHLTGVIVTHTDSDHAGGVYALASSSIRIDAWYTAAWCEKFKDSKNPVLLAAKTRGETVIRLKAGDTLPLDRGRLTVLGPTEAADTENNNSVVLLAEGGGGSMLLAGDMEFPEEALLLNQGMVPRCTVLKVGNHGESDATSGELLNAVRPQLAVISTDTMAEPDTPAPRVLRALAGANTQVVQTQQATGGVQVTLWNGQASAVLFDQGDWPAAVRTVRIAAKDNAADVITLRNDGSEAADLSGWFIRSDRGGEIFVLPAETVLPPGAQFTVTTLSCKKAGDAVWKEKNVWHDKKDDAAFLYDAYGRLMDMAD